MLSPCCFTNACSLGDASSRHTPTTFSPSLACLRAKSEMCGKTTLHGPHLSLQQAPSDFRFMCMQPQIDLASCCTDEVSTPPPPPPPSLFLCYTAFPWQFFEGRLRRALMPSSTLGMKDFDKDYVEGCFMYDVCKQDGKGLCLCLHAAQKSGAKITRVKLSRVCNLHSTNECR